MNKIELWLAFADIKSIADKVDFLTLMQASNLPLDINWQNLIQIWGGAI